MRQKIVAGNWKMNKTLQEGQVLTSEILMMTESEIQTDIKIILIPSFIHLHSIQNLIASNSKISLGAQNCAEQKKGAFTGEVSVEMLQSIPVEYVIVGHSERREYFQENANVVSQKIDLLLSNDLTPIFCCGEALSIREEGKHIDFVKNQIEESLFHLNIEQFSKLVIAYEPIWAIGTGKTATAQEAQEIHQNIRQFISEKYGKETAENLSILYGGSVKPSNAQELFAQADIDGALVGGASLKSRDFIDIAKSF